MLSTVLTALLRLLVDEMAPLSELLIWDRDVLWPGSGPPPPPPPAVLSESIRELRVLTEPLITVLTAVLKLVFDEIAPLRELLICDSDTVCPLSTVLTAVLKLDVDDIAPLKELLIWESEVLCPVPPPPPTAVLSELMADLTILIEPLMTVLTAELRLVVEETAPLSELLMAESEVLTLRLKLTVSEWAID